MQEFEDYYDSLLGLVTEEYALPDVENAFTDGSYCEREYARMRDAYERLCDRLGVEAEDTDLNVMVDALENIQKHLCRIIFERDKT